MAEGYSLKGLGLDLFDGELHRERNEQIVARMAECGLKAGVDYMVVWSPAGFADRLPFPRLRVEEGNLWNLLSYDFHGLKSIMGYLDEKKEVFEAGAGEVVVGSESTRGSEDGD
tara:strand:+ start:4043 stop:4384 length:342 start_codon:yes stop_codon:yes gene_type:complete